MSQLESATRALTRRVASRRVASRAGKVVGWRARVAVAVTQSSAASPEAALRAVNHFKTPRASAPSAGSELRSVRPTVAATGRAGGRGGGGGDRRRNLKNRSPRLFLGSAARCAGAP